MALQADLDEIDGSRAVPSAEFQQIFQRDPEKRPSVGDQLIGGIGGVVSMISSYERARFLES